MIKLEKLEELLDDANNIMCDFYGHYLENCDAIEECEICSWQKKVEKYFEEKK